MKLCSNFDLLILDTKSSPFKKNNTVREEMPKKSVTVEKTLTEMTSKADTVSENFGEQNPGDTEQFQEQIADISEEKQLGNTGQQETGKGDGKREEQLDVEAAVELSPPKEIADDMKMIVNSLFEEQDADLKDQTVRSGNEKDVFEKCEDCPYHKKHLERQEQVDVFEKMIQEYPKLPIYGATELFDCVRIHPKDIGKLDMRNWKLGVNSFLTHGFYTYQYLLLGKMRFDDGSERSIIGVPGVYSNREKYLANMFGFDQFIPVKKTGVKTGAFGYWIVEISPYLQ